MYDLGYAVNRRTDDHRKKRNLLSHCSRMDSTDHKDVHAAYKGAHEPHPRTANKKESKFEGETTRIWLAVTL
jgi:hypothetical protein